MFSLLHHKFKILQDVGYRVGNLTTPSFNCIEAQLKVTYTLSKACMHYVAA